MDIVTAPLAIVNTFGYGGDMNEKINQQNWLDAGLGTLAEHGPERVRIMPIAEELGVTKGSFYWHFKNLEEFHSALIAEWEHRDTMQAIEFVDSMPGDAQAKLQFWITGASGSDFRLVKAIRAWSMSNPLIAEVQTRVDAKRIDFLKKLLREVGWPKDDAETLANWTYWAFIGFSTLPEPFVSNKQLKLILQVLRPR
jgi:AcrR family transcriptional regulator